MQEASLGKHITLTASDKFQLGAYRADPADTPKGGVVVIQEIFGVNRDVTDACDYFASHGFVAVAPAVMDRHTPGFQTDNYGPDFMTKAIEAMKAMDTEEVLLDVEAAVNEAKASGAGKVGITGYCFGGRISWIAATRGLGLSAASGYYGGGIQSYKELTPIIPTEMHYGDLDQGIPMDEVEDLRKRHPDVGVYIYHAKHAFTNKDRPDMYDEAATLQAMPRTVAFFEKHLA
jgi:carboxymethylenebutenolidase